MKRTYLILFAGIAVAALAWCGFYFGTMAPYRAMLHSDAPELEWLKTQFKLGESEFKRISEMHEAYQPKCEEMCRLVLAKNDELRVSLAETSSLTPEIETKLAQVAELRASCQKMMLEHFFNVSRAMPPEQGRRYLEWVQEKTILCDPAGGMNHH